MKKIPVLIVDDSKTVRKLLSKCLIDEGYDVDEASNAIDAIKLAKYKKYHLILLDVVMPKINGFEACKIIKEEGKSKNTPIIFISADESNDANLKGHNVGSVDYLTKPINMEQLILKAAIHIKNSMLLDKLEIYKKRMQTDIKKANSFYHAFLPCETDIREVEKQHNVNIDSYFTPFNEIGGDFWKIINIDENKFGVLSIDFSGHGVASALNVAYLNAILSKNILWEDPISVMQFINIELSQVLQLGSFATGLYMVFDNRNNILKYVNCASPYPALVNKNGSKFNYYENSTQPLGLWAGDKIDMQAGEIKVNSGDTVFIYSDILLENKHLPNNERWMLEGLQNRITKLNSKPENKLENLREMFLKTATLPLSDDLTMISICMND